MEGKSEQQRKEGRKEGRKGQTRQCKVRQWRCGVETALTNLNVVGEVGHLVLQCLQPLNHARPTRIIESDAHRVFHSTEA